MTNTKNLGIAMVDINKIDELGSNKVYWLDDFRLFMWQPPWLDMEIKGRRTSEEASDNE